MTDIASTEAAASAPRPRLFVVRMVDDSGRASFTIAEEVAHLGSGDGHHDALEGALRSGLDHLFTHDLNDTLKVVGFPATRDPDGWLQIFEAVKPPKGGGKA